MMADQKNLVLAIVVSVSILLAYQMFFQKPRPEQPTAQQQTGQQQTVQQQAGQQQAGQQQAGEAQTETGQPVAGTVREPGSPAHSGDAAPQLGVDTTGIVGGGTAGW